MTNRARGQVSFEADGETQTVAFTMNAMCKYQDRAGETLIAAVDALQSASSDVVRIRRLFWAGLVGEFSEDQAGNIIDAIGLPKSFEILGDAVQAAFPQEKTDGAAPKAGKPKAAGSPPKPTS